MGIMTGAGVLDQGWSWNVGPELVCSTGAVTGPEQESRTEAGVQVGTELDNILNFTGRSRTGEQVLL